MHFSDIDKETDSIGGQMRRYRPGFTTAFPDTKVNFNGVIQSSLHYAGKK